MTREEMLEKALRRLVVVFSLDCRYHCRICNGSWTRFEDQHGVEQHSTQCALRRPTDPQITDPPEVPF